MRILQLQGSEYSVTVMQQKIGELFQRMWIWYSFINKDLLIRDLVLFNFLAGIYLLKFNNRNTRRRCETCSELTIKTPE